MPTPIRSILFLILTATLASACQVPVFRYALERWKSYNYQLFLVTPTALNPKQSEELSTWKKSLNHTNLTLQIIDTGKLTDGQLWQLPNIDTTATTAQLALYYPTSSKNKNPIVTLPYSVENLNRITDSPSRRAIVHEIIGGASCVWLVVHHGSPNEAQKIQSSLNTHLKKAEKAIKIPDGIIGTEERHKITPSTDLEDVLRSAIPLKIHFPSLLIDQSNPDEATFVATLLANSPPSIRNSKEPLIIPVFGRGRQLPPMPASRLAYEPILNGCLYLCGACSCQVKDQNPGFDLLIKENWPSHLTNGLAVVDKTLPPLDGVGDITQANQTQQKQEPTPKQTTPHTTASAISSNIITSSVLYIIGGAIALLALISAFILKR